uniref:Uncharacterized protein n=1 Tax=Schistocephalus solidus TaxID=70667 RepID=A0A0X3Q4X5_SCHSO
MNNVNPYSPLNPRCYSETGHNLTNQLQTFLKANVDQLAMNSVAYKILSRYLAMRIHNRCTHCVDSHVFINFDAQWKFIFKFRKVWNSRMMLSPIDVKGLYSTTFTPCTLGGRDDIQLAKCCISHAVCYINNSVGKRMPLEWTGHSITHSVVPWGSV